MNLPKGVAVKEVISFDVFRKAVAYKTTESWRTVPHAAVQVDLDVTEVMGCLEKAKRDPAYAGVNVTLNTVMLKVVTEGLKASPRMNAHLRYNPKNTVGELVVFDDINIAVPFLTDDFRMVTPVLKKAGEKSLRELCLAMADLRRRVANTNFELLLLEAGHRDTLEQLRRGRLGVLRRLYANVYGHRRLSFPSKSERRAYGQIPEKDRLTPDDLLTATTLVTNLGSVMRELPARIALLEVIPPQVAAFGLCAARKQPVAVQDAQGKDAVAIRWIMPVTGAADHRALDFAEASAFVKRVMGLCAKPDELFPGLA
ncbi:MAG TPA: 2-oxo acid dehydrogenase subunit E2 [Candidatus Hydrogenedentes bacterium]|nr:2-oxo acid dehydrogenase subunit E2 [Candidatus Hydrogenedentota bacterium]